MSSGDASPTAFVYETTEEARLLLDGADRDELSEAGRAASEAAYYLSDAIEPEYRQSLLTVAGTRLRVCSFPGRGARAAEALTLLTEAAGEVEDILRGPNASSELRIALRALRRGIDSLARAPISSL
ncbi:MAG TPA: hypothetical protein VFW29_10510 [Solirubrobacteraceae bacterium]|nr:hypothetical protein [Solirubrobacteraceae bacterium]